MRVISAIGGVLLIVIGILLVTGAWDHWMNAAARPTSAQTPGFDV